MAEHEPLELFGIPVEVDARVAPGTVQVRHRPSARELFLTGQLAQWAANDREPGSKPTAEERRRAGEGARAALGEILR